MFASFEQLVATKNVHKGLRSVSFEYCTVYKF